MDEVNTQEKTLAGKKILWVEDDKFLSSMIAKRLTNEGALLTHATDGEEAVTFIARDEKPDIVMLDIILPKLDGFQVLQKIKTNPATKDIPVILLSNLGQPSEIEKGQQLGALKFLVKATVSLDQIVKEIKKAVL
jgi:two-component system, sensor histidine kinase and response regulator